MDLAGINGLWQTRRVLTDAEGSGGRWWALATPLASIRGALATAYGQ